MTKFKVRFDKEFCRGVEENGISKELLVSHLKILRDQPMIGIPASPRFPSYRIWHTKLPDNMEVVIGYAVAPHFAEIDLSFAMLDSPTPPGNGDDGGQSARRTLGDMLLAIRLVAMLIKMIKEIMSLVT